MVKYLFTVVFTLALPVQLFSNEYKEEINATGREAFMIFKLKKGFISKVASFIQMYLIF